MAIKNPLEGNLNIGDGWRFSTPSRNARLASSLTHIKDLSLSDDIKSLDKLMLSVTVTCYLISKQVEMWMSSLDAIVRGKGQTVKSPYKQLNSKKNIFCENEKRNGRKNNERNSRR